MNKMETYRFILFLYILPCLGSELVNSKTIVNQTGSPLYFTYHVYMMDPVFNLPQSYTYYIAPDSIDQPRYKGTNLRGISIRLLGTNQTYTYSLDDINEATTIILKSDGTFEFH